MLQYAIDKDTQSLKHVDDVPNGQKCNCYCPACKDELEAHNGGKIQAHHFKHTTKIEHRSCLMTQLHLWGQYYFHNSDSFLIEAPTIYYENEQIENDQFLTIDRISSDLEHRIGKYFADVRIQTSVEDLLVEIKVTHGCEQEKIGFLRENKIACVEIDLSEFIDTPIDQVQQEFEEHNMRVSWIYPYDRDSIVKQHIVNSQIESEQRIATAKKNARSVLSSLIKSKSLTLPALTATHVTNTTSNDSDGNRVHLVLQEKVKASFSSVKDQSTEDYLHYRCSTGDRSLNVLAYFEDRPQVPRNTNESSIFLHPMKKSFEWISHSRHEELLKEAVRKFEQKTLIDSQIRSMIESQEKQFLAKDCFFKHYYGRWRSIILYSNLFAPTENRKNPPIPSGMMSLREEDSLWMFDAWPVYLATVLIGIIDSYSSPEIEYEDLIIDLTMKVKTTKSYWEIVDFIERNNLKISDYNLDFKSIITSLLRSEVEQYQLMPMTRSIVKTRPKDLIMSELYNYQKLIRPY